MSTRNEIQLNQSEVTTFLVEFLSLNKKLQESGIRARALNIIGHAGIGK